MTDIILSPFINSDLEYRPTFGIYVTSENAGRFVIKDILEHFEAGNIFVVDASAVARPCLISIWEHGAFRTVCFAVISPGSSSAGR